MSEQLRTPEEWLALKRPGWAILDPDGWRLKDSPRFDALITEREFGWRFNMCTVRQPAPAGPLSFTVVGKPEPAGSKRAFAHKSSGRVLVVDANRNAKPWQSAVAHAGAEAMAGRELLDEPLVVEMTFFQPRPQSHYGTGRNASLVRASAPLFPAGRPDVLKLARGVEDALTGVCWRDDARIVVERLAKFYGEPARVQVVIEIAITAAETILDARAAA